jgi:uncharacterized protein (TIGR00369 family)
MSTRRADSVATDADATLARWQADHEAARERMRQSGVARRERIAGLSGLEVMQALLRGELPHAPMADTLDFALVEIGFGRAVFQGRPLQRHYNPMGTVHGGWFATLLDSALGCAVHTSLPAGKAYTTVELKISVVRPLTDKVPLVRAEGCVIHGGSRMATADGRLTGADGRLYAHASTTCFVFDAP